MRMLIFLLLLIAMWLVSCEVHINETEVKPNWKLRYTKGRYPVEHIDTIIEYEPVKHALD